MTPTLTQPLQLSSAAARPWYWEWEAALLTIMVLLLYFTRLGAAPVCGEESRWASMAREMIATGDWVAPRQQGTVFPERPPLTSWSMALVGLVRGEVDIVAVRLPSVCAILALTLSIYAYARGWMSRLGSFSAAMIFATFGQVLQLGRFGESEAVFTLFTAGSFLVWHAGYMRGASPALTWSLAWSLVALGALTKGPQPPVYFAAACGVYLLWRRDWRWLFGVGHLAGLVCFAVIVGAWLVPFAVSHWHDVDDIWTGLARDRFAVKQLARHAVTYPLETLGCLLPWSLLIFVFVKPSVRKTLRATRPQIGFLVTALLVCYPTVWLAAGARGRYFMPLYPSVALLLGVVVEHCTSATASLADRLIWRRYQRGIAAAIVIGGVALVAGNVLALPQFSDAEESGLFLVLWSLTAVGAATALVWSSFAERSPRPQVAFAAAACFSALAYCGVIINSRIEGGNDLAQAVAEIKGQLPDPDNVVSLGSVYHRFAYSYETPIKQVPWPLAPEDVPEEVTYFCFDRRPGDSDEFRCSGDGRLSRGLPGKLPFEWELIAEIPCDPYKRTEQHSRSVVFGRRVRSVESVAADPSSRPLRR